MSGRSSSADQVGPVAEGETVARWMEKADGDLAVARILLTLDDAVLPSIIGFHAQQAIEKYLKAVLIARDIPFRRSHSITELRDLLDSLALAAHFPVTRFAVLERYPRLEDGDTEEPTLREVQQAFAYAEHIRSAVIDALAYEADNGS